MEEMRVYIANLGKYNEGELVGAWFEPPIDMDEVRERIGLNDQYEEYAIHDYELPFEIGGPAGLHSGQHGFSAQLLQRRGGFLRTRG